MIGLSGLQWLPRHRGWWAASGGAGLGCQSGDLCLYPDDHGLLVESMTPMQS